MGCIKCLAGPKNASGRHASSPVRALGTVALSRLGRMMQRLMVRVPRLSWKCWEARSNTEVWRLANGNCTKQRAMQSIDTYTQPTTALTQAQHFSITCSSAPSMRSKLRNVSRHRTHPIIFEGSVYRHLHCSYNVSETLYCSLIMQRSLVCRLATEALTHHLPVRL